MPLLVEVIHNTQEPPRGRLAVAGRAILSMPARGRIRSLIRRCSNRPSMLHSLRVQIFLRINSSLVPKLVVARMGSRGVDIAGCLYFTCVFASRGRGQVISSCQRPCTWISLSGCRSWPSLRQYQFNDYAYSIDVVAIGGLIPNYVTRPCPPDLPKSLGTNSVAYKLRLIAYVEYPHLFAVGGSIMQREGRLDFDIPRRVSIHGSTAKVWVGWMLFSI